MANLAKNLPATKPWTVTEKGQNFLFVAANLSTCGAGLATVLPHTVLAPQYKDFLRLYNKGFTVPVPPVLTERFNKTLDLLQIKKKERYLFEPFMACGFDVFSLGTQGRWGIHIGLPVNFRYNNVDDVDKSKIRVNQMSVIWETEEGNQLLNALIVPENAQLYAIAREIKLRNSFKIFFDTTLTFLGCSLTYVACRFINKRFNLYGHPRQVRLIGYGLVGLLNLGNYLMCSDGVQAFYENKVDRELKELDPVFAEGGRVFYEKLLERNKALRVLMGKEGESTYTVTGNENFFLRQKHLPLVQRKAFFEQSTTSSISGNKNSA